MDWMNLDAATLVPEIERLKVENQARNLRFSREFAAASVKAISESGLTIDEIDDRLGKGRGYTSARNQLLHKRRRKPSWLWFSRYRSRHHHTIMFGCDFSENRWTQLIKTHGPNSVLNQRVGHKLDAHQSLVSPLKRKFFIQKRET